MLRKDNSLSLQVRWCADRPFPLFRSGCPALGAQDAFQELKCRDIHVLQTKGGMLELCGAVFACVLGARVGSLFFVESVT